MKNVTDYYTICFLPDGSTIHWNELVNLKLGTFVLLPLMVKSIIVSPNPTILAESLYNGNSFDIPKSDWKYLSTGNVNRQ